MKECHDSKWAGHPGVHRTLALVSDSYYWPHLKDDVEALVKTCLVCQQNKIEQSAPVGSELNFSTSFHPQSDGQIERVNTLFGAIFEALCECQSKRLGETA